MVVLEFIISVQVHAEKLEQTLSQFHPVEVDVVLVVCTMNFVLRQAFMFFILVGDFPIVLLQGLASKCKRLIDKLGFL